MYEWSQIPSEAWHSAMSDTANVRYVCDHGFLYGDPWYDDAYTAYVCHRECGVGNYRFYVSHVPFTKAELLNLNTYKCEDELMVQLMHDAYENLEAA